MVMHLPDMDCGDDMPERRCRPLEPFRDGECEGGGIVADRPRGRPRRDLVLAAWSARMRLTSARMLSCLISASPRASSSASCDA